MQVRKVGWWLTALAGAAIVTVTLLPLGTPQPMVWSHCVLCGERGLADAIVNALLFLPLGTALALTGMRARHIVLRGALLSGGIELAQMLLPGRDPSPGDVLFNTIGIAMGAGLVAAAPRIARLTAGRAAMWSIVAGVLAAAAVGLTGWLLRPEWPATVYFGQWTPDLTYLEWYRGTVISAHLGDLPVRSRKIDDTDRARALLARGAPIRVVALAGPAPERLAPLFSVYDDRRIEILLVGPDRDALVYRYRARSLALRLDQPDLRFPGALRDVPPGDTLRVAVMPDPARPAAWCLSANRERRCGLGFTAGRGWAVLYYVEWFPEWLKTALDWLWLAAMFFPLGALLRRRWMTAVGMPVAAAALLLAPGALLPTPVPEYAAAVTGVGLGVLAARALARRTRSAAGG
jgi:hypothetical protein